MKNKHIIWFNHWFSTAYHIIKLIKSDTNNSYRIIGTSSNSDSVVKLACDEWLTEPRINTDEDYIDYCLNFSQHHKVDVFVPRRGMLSISKNAEQFVNCKTKLLLSTDYTLMHTLSDKRTTYEYFQQFLPNIIPPFEVIESFEDFMSAYTLFGNEYKRVCYKFTKDEGAKSFRVIDNRMEGYASLKIGTGNKVSLRHAQETFQNEQNIDPVMVMPYLDGPSVSVDCLLTNNGLICIPRFKTSGRYAEIRFDDEVFDICLKFVEASNMRMPFNLQLRYHAGKPYLLEVNSRMSGGIQQSCLATQINIPSIAINELFGTDIPWMPFSGVQRVSHIESPVLL